MTDKYFTAIYVLVSQLYETSKLYFQNKITTQVFRFEYLKLDINMENVDFDLICRICMNKGPLNPLHTINKTYDLTFNVMLSYCALIEVRLRCYFWITLSRVVLGRRKRSTTVKYLSRVCLMSGNVVQIQKRCHRNTK